MCQRLCIHCIKTTQATFINCNAAWRGSQKSVHTRSPSNIKPNNMIIRLSSLAGRSSRQNAASRRLLQQTNTRALSSIDEPHSHNPKRSHSAQPTSSSADFRSWQAAHNIDIQRVTQTAMIHELTQQQTRSIEKVVPWFLSMMPAPYFRQVPESFRLDHIKAISAIKDANMDMHMNLKTHLPNGRQVRILWLCKL